MAEQTEPAAPATRKAGAKVTVACKLPHGLILRVFGFDTRSEPVMGGGSKEVKVARQIGESVTLNGNAVPFGKAPEHPIIGGYALTHGVDKELFDKWLEQNRDSDLVRNRLIFAYESQDKAVDRAKEHAKARSGLEPIDPDNLPKGIQAADRKAA
jgi:hypothetical protein